MDQPSEEYLIFVERNKELAHYGIKRRSGRYPWGSGENPFQHGADFLARVEELREKAEPYVDPKTGEKYTGERAIAKQLGMTTTDLRMQERVAKHERRQLQADRAKSLRDDGKSLNEIAKIMGFDNDSSVRSLLNENTAANKDRARKTADILEKSLKENKMLDVGAGVERELGCSAGTLKEALFILETRGYNVYGVGIPQINRTGKQTITTVLADKSVEYADAYKNMGDIQSVAKYHSTDGGTTYKKLQYPESIKMDRVGIRYAEEGGLDKDGVMEIRRGVADLNLGNSHYAQVRILVDGTHYLKGMAMYGDDKDFPDGVDIIFNTNKTKGTPKEKVLKPIHTEDPANPFGAAIAANGQSYYTGKDGKEHLSAINKLKEEGAWDKMNRNLSSQFLSKQPIDLIKRQLKYTYNDYEAQLKEIEELTNPTIKRKFLLDFADTCDGAVTHLKAASLPRQSTCVLIPMPHLKDDEIYAPTYKDGEKVALVRYPHGGTFEIPILTVNNKNAKSRKILDPTIVDAVGINAHVAERLSGADFDGDNVTVIPTNSKVKINSTKALKGLEGFDPKTAYATDEAVINGKTVRVNASGIPVRIMPKSQKQKQMGIISNLITDMTLGGAPEDEIARAVRHSMVVIDAEKHKLDYKQSEKDNGIAELKKKWQVHTDEDGVVSYGGASTLLSRRKQDVRVPERKGSGIIDPETGEVSYKTSGRTYTKDGKKVLAEDKVSRLSVTKDLHTLSTGTGPEEAYADYGNQMKALANRARKEYMATGRSEYSKSAAALYANEVASLNAKVDLAARDAPKQRRALAVANSQVKALLQDNPGMDKKDIKKAAQIAIDNARASVGASGSQTKFTITDNEWKAIQAGAVSSSKLETIMRYMDKDELRKRATPKQTSTLSDSKIAKLKAMASSGFYTNQQIAEALGVSPSTVYKYMN